MKFIRKLKSIYNSIKNNIKVIKNDETILLRVGDRVQLNCGIMATIHVIRKTPWKGTIYHGKTDNGITLDWNLAGKYIDVYSRNIVEHKSNDDHPYNIKIVDERNRLKLNRSLNEFNQPLSAFIKLPSNNAQVFDRQ